MTLPALPHPSAVRPHWRTQAPAARLHGTLSLRRRALWALGPLLLPRGPGLPQLPQGPGPLLLLARSAQLTPSSLSLWTAPTPHLRKKHRLMKPTPPQPARAEPARRPPSLEAAQP